MRLAELFVEITGRDGGLNKSLAAARAGLMGMVGVAGHAGAGIASAFSGLTLAGGLLGGAAAVGLFKAFQEASELNATLSKTKVIFGDAAKTIIDKANEVGTSFGQNKTEFINAAASFGAVFKQMGRSQQEAAEMGNKLAKLGMDMASFEGAGVSAQDAFIALTAALKGEMNPIERFRVFLNEAKIEARALAMGLAKTKGEITDFAKKQATLSLIMEQTADAQGDTERTAGDSDNQYKKMIGTVQNLTAELGMKLLPAFTELLVGANEVLGGLSTKIESTNSVFGAFGTFVHETLNVIGFTFRNFGDIAALVGINVGEFAMNTVERFQYIGEVIGAFVDWFSSNFVSIIGDALNATLAMWMNWETNIQDLIAAAIKFVANGMKGPFEFKMTPLLEGFEAKTDAFKLPEQKDLTSFEADRQAVLDRIAENEMKRAGGQKAGAPAAPGAKSKPMDDTKPEKQEKAKFTDLTGFIKELQTGAFGKGEPKKQTELLTKIDKKLETQNAMIKKGQNAQPAPAVAN